MELLCAELLVRMGEFVAIPDMEAELDNEATSMSDVVLVVGTTGRSEVRLVKEGSLVVLLGSGAVMLDVELELLSEE